jgi:hypothetical protein
MRSKQPPTLKTKKAITLVGRASNLLFRDPSPDNHTVAFTLTINPKSGQLPLIVRCEGSSERVVEQFELMDEGTLVGIIGTYTHGQHRDGMTLVHMDRLEYLGRPLEVARA